jgi:hypothetical protein
MTEQEYLTNRVDDQINWLNAKSSFNQKRYKRLRVAILLVSVSIPLMSGFITDERWGLKLLVGAAGAIVAVCQGLLSLNKYHELWLQYRATAEALIRTKFLYQLKAGSYADNEKALQAFVADVESILANENSKWVEQFIKDTEKPAAPNA